MVRAVWGLCVLLLGLPCWASPVEVVLVSAESTAPYSQTEQALLTELVRGGVSKSAVLRVSVAELQRGGILEPAVRLLVALGTEALRQVLQSDGTTPVLAALIPRAGLERLLHDNQRKPAAWVTAVYLDQPFKRQLDLLRLAFPQTRRVGVLWGPESVLQQPAFASALQAQGWQEVGEQVARGGSPFSGLKNVLEDADVLLAVPDPQVYNAASVANIVTAAYRARLPMLGFSPAYVKAGALMSLYSSPAQIGTQAGMLVRSALQGAGRPVPQYPSDFSIEVNEHVARSLGLSLDAEGLAAQLRQLERRNAQ